MYVQVQFHTVKYVKIVRKALKQLGRDLNPQPHFYRARCSNK